MRCGLPSYAHWEEVSILSGQCETIEGNVQGGAVLELALVPDTTRLEGEGDALGHGRGEVGLLNFASGHVGGFYACL